MEKNFKRAVGFYEPFKVEKDKNETSLPLKEGDTFWLVYDGEGGAIDVEKQIDAEILSNVLYIKHQLDKLLKEGKHGKKKDV